jgi:hypothetical protein
MGAEAIAEAREGCGAVRKQILPVPDWIPGTTVAIGTDVPR